MLDVSRRPLVKDDLLLHLASHAPTQLRVLDVSLTVSPAGNKQRRQCAGCTGCRLLMVPAWSIPVAVGRLLVVDKAYIESIHGNASRHSSAFMEHTLASVYICACLHLLCDTWSVRETRPSCSRVCWCCCWCVLHRSVSPPMASCSCCSTAGSCAC